MPAGDFMPEAHRSQPLGPKCVWCDFPQIAIWLVFHTEALWNAAKASLGIQDINTLEGFRDWCKATDSNSRFCNALHLFSWLCMYRGLA